MDFRLLHISDIHFGPHIRCGADLTSGALELAAEIASDLETFGLLPVNAAVASGDFTHDAGREQFEAARLFLEKLSARIKLPLSSFVFVPGNHDMAWFPRRLTAKAEYESFFRKLRPGLAVPPCNADIVIFQHQTPPVVIVGLNSARFEDPHTAGLGYVGEGQILELLLAIREAGVDNSWRKIAVLHHHLLPVLNIDVIELLKPKEKRKVTMVVDAAGVLNFLLADGFDLVLHGHMHNAFCAVERREALPKHFPAVSAGEIVIHGAGTLGMDSSEGDAENHYSVISFEDRRIQIEGITRPIGKGRGTASPEKGMTTVELSKTRPKKLLTLPTKAEIKYMRVSEDVRETWLELHAFVEGDGKFRHAFEARVRSLWPSLGKNVSELQFTVMFKQVAAKFTDDRLEEHLHQLETNQISFTQYFLGLLKGAN
jgi:calcineurin-like phosphoesterase family protein